MENPGTSLTERLGWWFGEDLEIGLRVRGLEGCLGDLDLERGGGRASRKMEVRYWGGECFFFWILDGDGLNFWVYYFCICLRTLKISKKSLVFLHTNVAYEKQFPCFFYCNVGNGVTVSTFASFHSGTVRWLQAPHDIGYGCGLGSWTICHCFLGLQCGYVGSEDRCLGISPKKRGINLERKDDWKIHDFFFHWLGNLEEKNMWVFP